MHVRTTNGTAFWKLIKVIDTVVSRKQPNLVKALRVKFELLSDTSVFFQLVHDGITNTFNYSAMLGRILNCHMMKRKYFFQYFFRPVGPVPLKYFLCNLCPNGSKSQNCPNLCENLSQKVGYFYRFVI